MARPMTTNVMAYALPLVDAFGSMHSLGNRSGPGDALCLKKFETDRDG